MIVRGVVKSLGGATAEDSAQITLVVMHEDAVRLARAGALAAVVELHFPAAPLSASDLPATNRGPRVT